MYPSIHTGIACNLDSNIITATLPLLEQEHVEAIEWSFDALFNWNEVPAWFRDLLQVFADAGRLTGHGIFFSIFSARWSAKQDLWLEQLRQLNRELPFDHVSEHFGFMSGRDFHHGAPLSVPLTASTLAIGQDRLLRIQDACQCPVGLENLAFAFSLEEVRQHGAFLEQLLEPVNGFIILDLHNLYCQMKNFDLGFDVLIHSYPLHRVREIHISGGSWEPSTIIPTRNIRRDTHDDAVPEEVFEMLAQTIALCPALKFIFLEQLGAGLHTVSQQSQFRSDYLRICEIVKKHAPAVAQGDDKNFSPRPNLQPPSAHVQDAVLYEEQRRLSRILETASDCQDARQKLESSILKNSAWHTEAWPDYMLETALRIAQKWKDGF